MLTFHPIFFRKFIVASWRRCEIESALYFHACHCIFVIIYRSIKMKWLRQKPYVSVYPYPLPYHNPNKEMKKLKENLNLCNITSWSCIPCHGWLLFKANWFRCISFSINHIVYQHRKKPIEFEISEWEQNIFA